MQLAGQPTVQAPLFDSPTHQLPPAIAATIPIAHPGLPASFGDDNRGRHYRFENRADGGFADDRSIDESVVAHGLDPAFDALAGTGRVRGGAAEQQERQGDKDRGHADLAAIPARCADRASLVRCSTAIKGVRRISAKLPLLHVLPRALAEGQRFRSPHLDHHDGAGGKADEGEQDGEGNFHGLCINDLPPELTP